MSHLTIDQALQNALQLHRAGCFDDAEALYREILAHQAHYAPALQLLGALKAQCGQWDAAAALLREALTLLPTDSTIYNNLGTVLKSQGRLDDALASYRQALALNPEYAEAHFNLGIALLGACEFQLAMASLQEAIRLRPAYPEAFNSLGNALYALGQLEPAIAAYRQAIALHPRYVNAHNNLGNALTDAGGLHQAIDSYRTALQLAPQLADTHLNLGNAMTSGGEVDAAILSLQEALRLAPDRAEAHSNLGNAFKAAGRLDEAIASYRRALQLSPTLVQAHSNLVYALHFHGDSTPASLFAEHRDWNQRHALPLAHLIKPHRNTRDPDRRLRIGYVSPDFREHVVGRFFQTLLSSHDHAACEIFCYSNSLGSDAMTRGMESQADRWRVIKHLSDDQAANLIREDRIDILVDLTMHMARNRLLVFARKPAPVQVTYLAYCSTTGLDAMDYRLSDPYLDPPGTDDSFYSEKTVRLPETYWCYIPHVETPPVNEPPALQAVPAGRSGGGARGAGHVTFGCFNNFTKISPAAVRVWAQLLLALPDSRLILHAAEGSHRDRLRTLLGEQGITPDRCEIFGLIPIHDYFALHHRVDIALDPFPYAGGTTTCDALWMGVPVVTLAGKTAVGRGGVSILSNLGLPELIADSPERYLEIAAALARDLPRLARLRATLRPRMLASPLADPARFTRHLEAAYRQMWQRWCTKPASSAE